MTSIGGVSVLVLVVVLSFAVDRVVRALLFGLDFVPIWKRWFPSSTVTKDPSAREAAERRRSLLYFLCAGSLAIGVVVLYGDIRVIKALGYEATGLLDAAVTTIILMGGSELLGKLLHISGIGGGSPASSQPLEVKGTLVLKSASGSFDNQS